jgi:ethanolaminephosphotransferase
MIVSYSTLWYYAPLVDNYASLDEDAERVIIPRWVFLYQACAMLIYQTLDNMDGKQARKTNSSSPLGLLFDHGCDAVNVIFGTAGWILGLGLTFRDDPVHCVSLIAGTFSMFYIATWEEYYTGEMILPLINGPTEGVFGGALVSLTTFLYGMEFWQSTSVATALGLNDLLPFELRNADLNVALALFGMLREGMSRSIFVYRRHGGMQTMVAQLPLWILFVAGPLGSRFWFRMPRTTIHLGSGLMVEAVTQMMLDHITEQPFNPLLRQRFLFLPLVALLLCCPEANETTDILVLVYTTAVWTYLFVKIRLVVHEICVTLNLKCFDITSKSDTKKE